MKVLLLNQCFYPDVVATAQYLTDLALELKNAGHDVTVVASSRGYDSAKVRFPSSEVWNGIRIVRVKCTGLGKETRWRRAVDFATFFASCAARVLLMPRFDVVVALTSPPLISVLATVATKLRGGQSVLWLMDVNPDEAVVAGWLKAGSATERLLSTLLRFSLREAHTIVALDRFMQQRIAAKGIDSRKIHVIPPWVQDDAVSFNRASREAFRAAHGLTEKFVVMYSGNHSPCHPLDTLLGVAEVLAQRAEIVFCFIGGGSEFQKVKEFAASRRGNIFTLPYQPRNQLSASLSAADLHVVVLGRGFVGILHPSKIYNILAVGAPVLYIGPAESHVTEILRQLPADAYQGQHGEVEAVAREILRARERARRSSTAATVAMAYSKRVLARQIVALLEAAGGQLQARQSSELTTNTHAGDAAGGAG
jgi:glycosyltransferase involved in cell wall biosynthesis